MANESILALMDLKDLKNSINQVLSKLITEKEVDVELKHIILPLLDIRESKERIIIEVELPCVRKEDIKITLYKNFLEMRGVKRQCPFPKERKFTRIERSYGEFIRIIELNCAIDITQSRVTLEKGILKMDLKKIPEKRGRININIEWDFF